MDILAFETSCDETSVAVVRNGREILSCEVFSQVSLHALYGGVVPEIASRNHLEKIVPLTRLAFKNSGLDKRDISAIAVTAAPGLIGALLVGVSFAKSYAMALRKPLIPVHHIKGHIASAYLSFPELEPPFICAAVSGGHTLIMDVLDYTRVKILASTRDDAAGEAFDKAARVMGLGYPGGAELSRHAESGDNSKYSLPLPVVKHDKYDMSFSGIKTALCNLVNNTHARGEKLDMPSLAASFEKTLCEGLISRIKDIMEETGREKVALVGGVAANRRLRESLTEIYGKRAFIPDTGLCGDNAAMIASQGYYEYIAGKRADMSLNGRATMPPDQDY